MVSLKKILNKFIVLFSSSPAKEELIERKKHEDYNYLRSYGVETELGYVELIGKPIIKRHIASKIIIGKNVTLVSESYYNEAGVNHPVILATEKEGVQIVIEDGCGLSGTSVVAVSGIRIGKNSQLGVNTNIWDTDFHPINSQKRLNQTAILDAPTAPILIGENVWIGANSTLLKGIKIGDNSVIGAHSLVNKSIGSNEVYAGNPARFIKKTE